MQITDSILIKQLQHNSVKAFDALYQRYSARLYNFILKISNGNIYQSEEILQRVFIKIWETRNMIDPEKSFNTYVCAIAKNMLINELNHETVKYIYSNYMLNQGAEASYSVDDDIEFEFLTKYLETLINELPPASREVYKLSRLKYYSNKEIAALLNKSESTVENQLTKANKYIKEKMKQHFDKIFIFLLSLNIF